MSNTVPDWGLFRSFLAVVRNGSLSAAARTLGQTQPTLGRHIEQLEALLGQGALFTRSSQGLTPTETALDLLPYAEAMEAAAAALLRSASAKSGQVAGTVRLTASEIVAVERVPTRLVTLKQRYPGLVFELVASNRYQDLLRRDCDIAIRMLRPTQEGLFARKAGVLTLGLYAHRDYLDASGMPTCLADLARHALIGFDTKTPAVQKALAGDMPIDRTDFSLRSDSDLAQLAALRSGFGIGICQRDLARANPNLVPILPDQFSIPLETWIVMHEDLRTNPKLRAVFDFLAETICPPDA